MKTRTLKGYAVRHVDGSWLAAATMADKQVWSNDIPRICFGDPGVAFESACHSADGSNGKRTRSERFVVLPVFRVKVIDDALLATIRAAAKREGADEARTFLSREMSLLRDELRVERERANGAEARLSAAIQKGKEKAFQTVIAVAASVHGGLLGDYQAGAKVMLDALQAAKDRDR